MGRWPSALPWVSVLPPATGLSLPKTALPKTASEVSVAEPTGWLFEKASDYLEEKTGKKQRIKIKPAGSLCPSRGQATGAVPGAVALREGWITPTPHSFWLVWGQKRPWVQVC